jgi:hypothetical protein
LILVRVVKWALDIEGDSDVTGNDRDREPSAENHKRDHETSLRWANRSTLHPTPLWLWTRNSRGRPSVAMSITTHKACAVFWKASSVNRDSFDVGHQSGRRFDIGVLEL